MPHYFFDTSALVKHYHTEPGSLRVDHFVCSDQRLCDIALLEGLAVINPEQP
jgi:hypothetical protein